MTENSTGDAGFALSEANNVPVLPTTNAGAVANKSTSCRELTTRVVVVNETSSNSALMVLAPVFLPSNSTSIERLLPEYLSLALQHFCLLARDAPGERANLCRKQAMLAQLPLGALTTCGAERSQSTTLRR